MDPDANLEEQRRTIDEINRLRDTTGEADCRLSELGCRLAELAEALDEWISKGGLMPQKWAWPRRNP